MVPEYASARIRLALSTGQRRGIFHHGNSRVCLSEELRKESQCRRFRDRAAGSKALHKRGDRGTVATAGAAVGVSGSHGFARFSDMAGRQWLRKMSSMKVKEVPSYIKENVTPEKVKQGVKSWMDEYAQSYIDTGSIKPLWHLLIGGLGFCYIMAYPTELRHYQHAEEERLKKLKGGDDHSKGGHH